MMKGKTVLITGATGGIGAVTAESLAKMGAQVAIVGRSRQKVNDTAGRIRHESGNPAIEGFVANLSEMAQVRALSDEIHARFEHLDVLINNAGALFLSREVTAEGLERTFALNHMAYFLLTGLLLDLLNQGAPARIVNVSSAAHVGARLNLDDLQMEKGFTGWSAYSRSKLMNLYFTYELARQLDSTSITVNALHPGFVATNFGRSNGGVMGQLFLLSQLAAISPEQGAETSIYLASSPEVEGITGAYFSKSKAVRSSEISYNRQIAEELWQRSAEIAGINVPTQQAGD